MSASQTNALDAIRFDLVAALEAYDRDAGRLVAAWPDPALYRDVSEQVDRIRMYCASLPSTRVRWVEVLVLHSGLIRGLWRANSDAEAAGGEIGVLREQHSAAVAALRRRCLRTIIHQRPRG